MKQKAERLKPILVAVLMAFGLGACATGGSVTPVVTTLTPAQVQSLAADVGYLAYEFSPASTAVQPVLAGVCMIDTTQDPIAMAQQFQQLLSKVWTGIDAINTPEGTVIVLLINNLVSDLGLNSDLTSVTTTISPYMVSAVVGLCQGVQAAQTGNMPKELKASLAVRGITPAPMGLPPSLVIPGNYTVDNLGAWGKLKKALGF
ncbi:MAG: hypothetical protein ACP5SH_18185 [Syntrophobacteraceae bacterium]